MKVFIILGMILAAVHATIEDDLEIPDVDEPETEDGMLYTVPQTIDQAKNFFAGFLIGFYHDNRMQISEKCLEDKFVNDVEFIYRLFYKQQNLIHILDVFKLPKVTNKVIMNMAEECGYKNITLDIQKFCDIDPSRCTLAVLLSNLWWRLWVVVL